MLFRYRCPCLTLIYLVYEFVLSDLPDVDVKVVIPDLSARCNKLGDVKENVNFMTKDWLRLNLTSAGSLSGVFLASCRDLVESKQRPQYYTSLSMQYKSHCFRALHEAISSERSSQIRDSTVAIAMLLAFDEVGEKSCDFPFFLDDILDADRCPITADTPRWPCYF